MPPRDGVFKKMKSYHTCQVSSALQLISGACIVAACAGGDAPVPSPEVASAISAAHGSGRSTAAGGAASVQPADGSSEAIAGAGGSAGAGGGAGAANLDETNTADPSGGGSAGASALPPEEGTGEDDTDPEEPSEPPCDGFAILQASCGQGGCHGAGSNLGNFAESEAVARSYIGRSGTLTCASAGPLIDPDDPAASVIVQKVLDDPPCGNYMPPSGGFLSASEVACIEDWIGSL